MQPEEIYLRIRFAGHVHATSKRREPAEQAPWKYQYGEHETPWQY